MEGKIKRNLWIDCCKGVLIILVVVGHFCIKAVTKTDVQLKVLNSIAYIIYSFHMPAFIILSGLFFKKKSMLRF